MAEPTVEVIALKFIDCGDGSTDVQTVFQPPTMNFNVIMRRLVFGAYLAAEELGVEREDLEDIIEGVLDAAYSQRSEGTIYTGPRVVK